MATTRIAATPIAAGRLRPARPVAGRDGVEGVHLAHDPAERTDPEHHNDGPVARWIIEVTFIINFKSHCLL